MDDRAKELVSACKGAYEYLLSLGDPYLSIVITEDAITLQDSEMYVPKAVLCSLDIAQLDE